VDHCGGGLLLMCINPAMVMVIHPFMHHVSVIHLLSGAPGWE
jgi:hypothetical protein